MSPIAPGGKLFRRGKLAKRGIRGRPADAYSGPFFSVVSIAPSGTEAVFQRLPGSFAGNAHGGRIFFRSHLL